MKNIPYAANMKKRAVIKKSNPGDFPGGPVV